MNNDPLKYKSVNLLTPEQERQAMLSMPNRWKMVSTGKAIVYFFAISNIVINIFNFIVGTGNLTSLIILVALSIALMSGANLARILFIIGMGLGAIVGLYTLVLYAYTPMQYFMIILHMIYNATGGILLYASDSVEMYMYEAKDR